MKLSSRDLFVPNHAVVLLFSLVVASGFIESFPTKGSQEPECYCGLEGWSYMIFGGHQVSPGQYPWIVYVGYLLRGSIFTICAGTIINDRYILTGAHCLDEPQPLDEHLLIFSSPLSLGTWTLQHGVCTDKMTISNTLSYKRVIRHENYSETSATSADIALIELRHPLTFNSTFAPICLPGFTDFDNFVAAGWGETKEFDDREQECLMEADLKLVNRSECTRIHKDLQPYEICAGGNEKNACPGDSGGPLMTRRHGVVYQAGIIKGGRAKDDRTCGPFGLPAIFDLVPAYADWIREKTGNAKWCRGPEHLKQ